MHLKDGMNALGPVASPASYPDTPGWGTAIVLGLILLGLVVALAKAIDLWRRRRRDRVYLRSTVASALMRSERLGDRTLVPRVRLPFWSGSPATVVVSGTVQTGEERELARTTAREAALTVRSDIDLLDRMTVAAPRTRAA